MALDVWGESTGHKRSLTHHPWFSRLGHPVCYSLASYPGRSGYEASYSRVHMRHVQLIYKIYTICMIGNRSGCVHNARSKHIETENQNNPPSCRLTKKTRVNTHQITN